MPHRTFGMVFTQWSADVPMHRVARDACRNGYAVIPVKAGGKNPVCTLNARELNAAGPNHPCGVHHFITDPKVAERVFRRLGEVNLGIVAHPSRVVVVDADTPEQVESFLELLRIHVADAAALSPLPTVSTPGARAADGTMRHSQGGHWYFDVPEGLDPPLPQYPGSMTLAGGASMRWGMSMTVAPPSTRLEGPYMTLGEDLDDIPPGLLGVIREHVEHNLQHAVDLAERWANDPVAAWSVSTSWSSLLEPDGWSDTGKVDRACGCPVFEKPGGGSTTTRSAIAHGNDCTHPSFLHIEGHGALHLFTDDPPPALAGRHNVTKLQYLALVHYDGDETATKIALGIEPDYANWSFTDPQAPRDEEDKTPGSDQVPPSQSPKEEGYGDAGPQHEDFWMADETSEVRREIRRDAGKVKIHRRALELVDFIEHGVAGTEELTVIVHGEVAVEPNMDPAIGHRTDEVPLLYRGRVNCIFGRSEQGKSWFTLACALTTRARGWQVLLIDCEDDYSGFDVRMQDVGIAKSAITYARVNSVLSTKGQQRLAQLAKDADLVIVDSFDGLLAILGYGDSQLDVRRAGAFLKRLALSGNAAVLLVDHSSEKDSPGKDVRDQMGSSAKKQFVDGVLLFARALTPWKRWKDCQTIVEVGKDRYGRAKDHAIFPNEAAKWGRLALLRMTPGILEDIPSELVIDPPPSYEALTDNAGAVDVLATENRIIDYLRDRAGEWQSETSCMQAGGDKNGRGNQRLALDNLVAEGVLERRSVAIRGGREGTEYRYVHLDDEGEKQP